jgi:thiamine-monophosphate kinase
VALKQAQAAKRKSMSEFDLIRRLQEVICCGQPSGRLCPVIGIGDDGAILAVPCDRQLVATTDTLVEGVHFLTGVAARDLGHKALAVNLSDLASMGAEPAWFFLNITMPANDSANVFEWLDDFAHGIADLAENSSIMLAGGDTTSGPLSVTITALGLVEPGMALTRAGACVGDLVVVSGTLGAAAHAMKLIGSGLVPDEASREALDRPSPRLMLGRKLNGLATACIDVSDGLLADLGHILRASSKGAEIELGCLPGSAALTSLEEMERLELQTTGGDDYELCFTITAQRRSELDRVEKETGIHLSVIGRITATPDLVCKTRDGKVFSPATEGYVHFVS